jgi:hypothetical protein
MPASSGSFSLALISHLLDLSKSFTGERHLFNVVCRAVFPC